MNSKFKSLSDSSTSESEDDIGKRGRNSISYEPWTGVKRTLSSEGSQEEQPVESYYNAGSSAISSFKSPQKRHISTDDTEDEHSESPIKKFKLDMEAEYLERELSTDPTDSESDDKGASMSMSHTTMNVHCMPSMDNLSGNCNVGMKLMEKMGYKSGTGLGKHAQGRVNIVEASKQRGRRGLGLTLKGFEPSTETWDMEQDPISLVEEVLWIPECSFEPPSIKDLREWMVEGKKKMNIDDETEFIDPSILEKVLAYKSVFDELEGKEMRDARAKSNPFETIRGGMFLNRAAMKMANMDSAFDYMFTNPRNEKGESLIGKHDLLYFADVCAGPGGFSEYVLWKKRWECKGFGFTLKGPNDFKLSDFFSGPPETFEPYYGELEDGDIYKPANLRSFKKLVFANTDEKGVHFVMADGGFSVDGKENLQEILSKRLYLCQFLCALNILRTGGHFVCKLFDLFTPFSVGLVYLMYMAFEEVCIFKPNTSRPANSERYIICKSLKENSKDICDYMFEMNDHLDSYGTTNEEEDIIEVVPLHVLKENEQFYDYILESNNVLGAKQIIYLDKIRAFAQNTELVDDRQNKIRSESFRLWNVPEEVRTAPARGEPNELYKQLLQGQNLKCLNSPPEPLTEASLKKLENIFDFNCVVCGDATPTLFIGMGRGYIFQYDEKNTHKPWTKLDPCHLELPARTLFYGELILELKGEHRAQKRIQCLHIIDVLYLGGKDVRNFDYKKRMMLAGKLATAVSKPSIPHYMLLRVKKVWELRNIEGIFDKLCLKLNKGSHYLRLSYELDNDRHFIPTGLLIFRITSYPWLTAFSKTSQRAYLFNTKDNTSVFEKNADSTANFQTCFSKRIFWSWEKGVQLIPDQEGDLSQEGLLHGNTVKKFVEHREQSLTGRVKR